MRSELLRGSATRNTIKSLRKKCKPVLDLNGRQKSKKARKEGRGRREGGKQGGRKEERERESMLGIGYQGYD